MKKFAIADETYDRILDEMAPARLGVTDGIEVALGLFFFSMQHDLYYKDEKG